MLEPVYRAIYTRLGGQPFTHRVRDAWKQEPTGFLFLALALGMMGGRYLSAGVFWWVLGSLFGGVVLGHLFWPTTYGIGRHKKDA